MVNPFLANVSRAERRMALSIEATARRTGDWGDWEIVNFPKGSAGRGWAAEFECAYRNACFCVMYRILKNGVKHLMVSTLSGMRPSWWEMQRIKDTIAGKDATAIEIYPPHEEIVDDADAFHIWILTSPLEFGLK